MSKIYAAKSPVITQREIDHMALSKRMAGECMVLLENDGALPIARAGKLALFGNGARHTIRGGTGSGDVNTRMDVNIEQGLERAGFTVTTKKWLDRQDEAYIKAREEYRVWFRAYAQQENMSEQLVTFRNCIHKEAGL